MDSICNLFVFGKNGVGKSWFIDELFKQMNLLKQIYSDEHNSRYDARLIDKNYEVNVELKEIRAFEDINFYHRNEMVKGSMIFLIILNRDNFHNSSYEREFIKKVERKYPEALFYFVIVGPTNNNYNNFRSINIKPKSAALGFPKIGKSVRDVFFINTYDGEDFYFLKKILKN